MATEREPARATSSAHASVQAARQTVADLLGQPLPIGRLLPLAAAAAGALADLHAAGRIHGSLHPGALVLGPGEDEIRIEAVRARPTGALAYLAPEESDRSAAEVGPHSDLYSLGTILYTLAAGMPPFLASDPLEWVHCHVALPPEPVGNRRRDLPPVVAEMIMRLLAKAPEARYRSALSLSLDFERCWTSWRAREAIAPFPLDALDQPGRLAILPLYSRERELAELQAAFARTREGGRELVRVAGPAGVGKSALVRVFSDVVAEQGGLLAGGKVEEADRAIPYAGLATVVSNVVRQLVEGASDRELAGFRELLSEAVHPNGQLLIDFAPSIERLIGAQPEAPELSLADAQRRFSEVLRRFLGTLASQRPLVLFVDDLQWANPGTVELLAELLEDERVEHLLVVVAYRPAEAQPALRESLRTTGGRDVTLSVRPLSRRAVTTLVADALGREASDVVPLAHHLQERSGGNPFFLTQLLTSLQADGVIAFDRPTGAWQWDDERLGPADATNVIDLTHARLLRLPDQARELLATAACVGRPIELALFAEIAGATREEVEAGLEPAKRAHLIAVRRGTFSFVHDNVRVAAELLLEDPIRRRLHRRIADGLIAVTEPERLGERVFAIVEHLEQARESRLSPSERSKRASLYLLAGRRAKSSNAYDAAADYLDRGLAAAPDADRDLLFALRLERTEVAVVRRELDRAAALLDQLQPSATTPEEISAAARIAIEFHLSRGAAEEAVEVGVAAARALGLDVERRPGPERAQAAYDQVAAALGDREIEELVDLPPAEDPLVLAQLRLLVQLYLPAYFTDPDLTLMVNANTVRISIEHGNAPDSTAGYAAFGGQVVWRFQDPPEAYRWGRLALELAERQGNIAARCSAELNFASMILHHVRPFSEAEAHNRRASRDAMQVGAVSVACYCAVFPAMFAIAYGMPLREVARRCAESRALLEGVGYTAMVDRVLSTERLLASVRGETAGLGRLDGPGFDHDGLEQRMREAHPPPVRLGYEIMRTRASLYGGDLEDALDAARRADALLWSALGILDGGEAVFYCAIAYARAHDVVDADRAAELREAIDEKLTELRRLAVHGPSHRHRAALVEAEVARLDGDTLTAIERYDEAIRLAAQADFNADEGLAAELAADFHRRAGRGMLAEASARHARDAYLRWEATAKAEALEREYPGVRGSSGPGADLQTGSLDTLAIVKTSRAISASMVLSELLDTLLRVTLQHAGADAGSLALVDDGQLRVRAEATAKAGEIRVRVYSREDAPSGGVLPQSIVGAVLAGSPHVVVEDALSEHPYTTDPYVRATRPRSVLCLPITVQTEPAGLLYLENRHVPGSFTPERLVLLRHVAAQAAISLENARLFEDLERENSERRRTEVALREAEESYRSIFENALEGIFRTTPEGTIVAANPALARMLGYASPDELMTAIESLPDQLYVDAGRRRTFLDLLEANDAVHGFETQFFRKDGSVIWVSGNAHAVRDGSGRIVSIEGTAQDITERKRAESEQARLEDELRQAQKMEAVGRLAGGVAHDFNNLLTAIGGYTELLLAALPDGDARRSDAEEIQRAAERARALTQQLLAFSRRQPVEPQNLDLNDVVSDMERLLRRLIGSDVDLVTLLDPDLPTVEADRGQLEQVIVNLALNARDAMPSGGMLAIETSTVSLANGHAGPGGPPPGQYVTLVVRDTGIGMEAETRARIFEPFFTTKEVGRGTGLGLSTVYGIVEQSGGRVAVESEPGLGTTFTISLPASGRTDGEQARPGRAEPAKGGAETVLLVEDDDVIRTLAARTLREHGYDVVEVRNASEALVRWQRDEHAIDVVLSDVVMPGMSGAELAERLATTRPETRIVLMSGFSDFGSTQRLLHPSGASFLAKPFTPSQLLRAVREAADSTLA